MHVHLRGMSWRQRLDRACLAQALCTLFAGPDMHVALGELMAMGDGVSRARRQLQFEGSTVSA